LIGAAFAFGLLFSASETNAQDRSIRGPGEKTNRAKKPTVVKPIIDRSAGFERVRFDPRRDPHADLAAAKIKARAEQKNIILYVGGEWCSRCIYTDKFFYQRPEIERLRDENYVWLKVNMSPQNQNRTFLAAYPAITGYPHLFVLDEAGNLLHSQKLSQLENRDGYDPRIFTEFLTTWSRPRVD
jgi:hypothetical protein